MKKDLYFYSYSGKPSGVDAPIARKYIRDGWLPAPRTVLKGRQKIVADVLPKVAVALKDVPAVLEETLVSSMGKLKGQKRTMMFSGGFDSMLMVLLARRFGADIKGVTIQFEDFNVATVQSAVVLAKQMGLSHKILEVSVPEFLVSFQAVAQLTDEPLLDLDMPLVHAAFRKYHSKMPKQVFISGMGSDQWLGNIALEPEYGSLQERLDMTTMFKNAHDQVAKLFGHRFVFPYLSQPIVSLSQCMTPAMKKDKKILRTLAEGSNVTPVHNPYRELQVPEVVRRVLLKAFGGRAWPAPIAPNKLKTDEPTLRQIVLGLWLEKQNMK